MQRYREALAPAALHAGTRREGVLLPMIRLTLGPGR